MMRDVSDAPKRGRGRPRREGTDEEILSVARMLLAERGYRELTVDAVAERAGVAKTTVYRRWPSKGTLVAAVVPPPPPGSDVAAILRETEERLAPLADAEDDAEILGVLRAILAPRLALLRQLDTRADALLGAIFMRLFVR